MCPALLQALNLTIQHKIELFRKSIKNHLVLIIYINTTAKFSQSLHINPKPKIPVFEV